MLPRLRGLGLKVPCASQGLSLVGAISGFCGLRLITYINISCLFFGFSGLFRRLLFFDLFFYFFSRFFFRGGSFFGGGFARRFLYFFFGSLFLLGYRGNFLFSIHNAVFFAHKRMQKFIKILPGYRNMLIASAVVHQEVVTDNNRA